MSKVRLYENSRACSVGFPFHEIDGEEEPETQAPAKGSESPVTLDAAEIERREHEAFLRGFKMAAEWIAGPKLAPFAIATLADDTTRSDVDIAAELGVSKQAVGKFQRRIRRNAGMGLRMPGRSNSEGVRAAVPTRKKRDLVKSKENPAQ